MTFRVEVNYVEIDAIVTDGQGNFVRNLSKEDFEIVEEGKPQELSVLSLVDIPVERTDAPLFSPTAIEPDVRSNVREFNGRVFVLVLDDLQTHFARSVRVRAAAKLFIERYLGANDIAAIVQTGARKDGAQEFTSNRRLLLKAINNFAGQKIRSATLDKLDDYYMQREVNPGAVPRDLSDAERAFKARNTLSTLRQVADYLAGVRGRRKAVVYFSEGIDYDINNTIQNRYASELRDEMLMAIAAATRANVSFYGVDPRGLSGLSDEGIEITSVPNDPTLGLGYSVAQRRAPPIAGQPAHGFGGDGRLCGRQPQRLPRSLLADHSGQQRLLPARVLLERYAARRPLPSRPGPCQTSGSDRPRPQGLHRVQGQSRRTTTLANTKTSAEPARSARQPDPDQRPSRECVRRRPQGSRTERIDCADARSSRAAVSPSRDENGLFVDDVEVSVIALDRDAKIKDGGRDVRAAQAQTPDARGRDAFRHQDRAPSRAAARQLPAPRRRS